MSAAPAIETPDERTERLRRRLIAARALADITVKELAARIQEAGHTRGYSADNLGLMERGKRPIQPQNIAVLAEACGVSPAFFSVDLAALGETADAANGLRERIESLEAEQTEDSIRLAQLEEAVRKLTAKDLHGEGAEGGPQ